MNSRDFTAPFITVGASTWRRLLGLLAVIFLTVIIAMLAALVLYERYANGLRFARVPHTTDARLPLRELEATGPPADTEPQQVLVQMRLELRRAAENAPPSLTLAVRRTGRLTAAELGKFFGGAALCWFLSAIAAVEALLRWQPRYVLEALAGFPLGAVLGVGGLLIPVCWPAWVSVVVYTVGQLIVLAMIIVAMPLEIPREVLEELGDIAAPTTLG